MTDSTISDIERSFCGVQRPNPSFFRMQTTVLKEVNKHITTRTGFLLTIASPMTTKQRPPFFQDAGPFRKARIHVKKIVVGFSIWPSKFIMTADFKVSGQLYASIYPVDALTVVFVIIVGI